MSETRFHKVRRPHTHLFPVPRMTRRWLAILSFLVALGLTSAAIAGSYQYKGWQRGPWEHHKTKDNMTMWLNEDVHTGVHGIRVDTVVDIEAGKLFPVMMDEERQGSYSFIREFKIIKRYDNWGYLYQRVQSTGIQDRDFTVKLVMLTPDKYDGQWGWVWEQANDKGPAPRDGIVRATVVSGSYVLTPVGDGTKTRISYRLWFDPSSWVPDFLINGAVRNAGFETVRDLRRAAEKIKKTGSWK